MGPRPLLCYQPEEQEHRDSFLSADVNKHRTDPAADFSICCQPDVRAGALALPFSRRACCSEWDVQLQLIHLFCLMSLEESSHHGVESCC